MYDENDILIPHPFTKVVCGPSGCGKSTYTRRFLSEYHEQTTFFPDRNVEVLYCYGIWTTDYNDEIINCNLTYREGIPDVSELEGYDVIVLDDMMEQVMVDKRASALFTRVSHHMNISVIFLTQNLFCQGKQARNINLNAQYFVFFLNFRDKRQIAHVARQVYDCDYKAFLSAFSKATKRQDHGYLWCDLSNNGKDELRIKNESTGK